MKNLERLTLLFTIILSSSTPVWSQSDQLSILNEVIIALEGDQDIPELSPFKSIEEACRSEFVTCNKRKQVKGLNFQFANLNGYIPSELTKLEKLVWINLEYNYLTGTIPNDLSSLDHLNQVLVAGNFLVGPLPKDILKLNKETQFLDLSKNAFDIDDPKLLRKLDLKDQIKLEGCRSPDSIFLLKADDLKNRLFEVQDPKLEFDSLAVDSLKEMGEKDLLSVVESMPRFPGCEIEGMDISERENCGKEKMLQFIYKNLRYPDVARELGVQGFVVVQFVVLEDGSIGDVTKVIDPGGRTGNAGLWVVNRINYLCEKWIPGMQNNKAVKVLYTLPVKFKLQ